MTITRKQSGNPFSTSTGLKLGSIYSSNVERTAYHLQLFKALYDLPSFQHEETVTPDLFAYCQQRNHFINIIAYQSRKIFLARSMGAMLGWALPGSSILSNKDELLQDAVYRIISRDIPNIEIGEPTPIAYLEKTYKCNNETVTHHGISFMARVRSPRLEKIEHDEYIKGRFIAVDNIREIKRMNSFDAELFNLAKSHICALKHEDIETIESEILSSDSISAAARYLHDNVVGPFGREFSSKKIKKEILKYIKETDYFLDVACGDDDFIWQAAGKAKFCAANDIQWKLITTLISKQKNHANKVVFVNHDACALPFKKRFDLVLCKNMLHHMATRDQLVSLLTSLRQVAKRILIVDPEDPTSSQLGRMWHHYYVKFLKDRGERLFNQELLEKTIREFYTDASNINVQKLHTIKGYFIFASIEFIEDSARDLSLSSEENDTALRVIEIMHDKRLVILDFDGLLFDTERPFLEAIRKVLKKHGIELQDNDYISTDLQHGTSLLEHYVETGLLDSNNISKIQDEIYFEYNQLIENGITAMPGAIKTIELLDGKYKIAIASSSKRIFIDRILKQHGLAGKFDFIVARENTRNLKPNPECLKLILKELSHNINESIIFEDTLRGLRAAKAIGMKCIIVPNDLTKEGSFDGADLVVNSLLDLVSIFEVAQKRRGNE